MKDNKKKLHLTFIVFLLAGIIFMANPINNSSSEATAQTATVECYDAGTVGEGWDTHRICVEGMEAYCQIDYFSDYESAGTCTFTNPGEEGGN